MTYQLLQCSYLYFQFFLNSVNSTKIILIRIEIYHCTVNLRDPYTQQSIRDFSKRYEDPVPSFQ